MLVSTLPMDMSVPAERDTNPNTCCSARISVQLPNLLSLTLAAALQGLQPTQMPLLCRCSSGSSASALRLDPAQQWAMQG